MEKAIVNNDLCCASFLHVYPRRLTLSPPVAVFGYIPEKTHIIDWKWPHRGMSVAFVTEGDGFFILDGKRTEVTAPFAFVELPDRHVRYGPTRKWRQYYIHYFCQPEVFLNQWKIDPNGPLCWPVASPAGLQKVLDEIVLLIDSSAVAGYADRIDELCQLAILESRFARDTEGALGDDTRILDAELFIRANYRKHIDIERLGRDFGFSRAAFYRHWKRLFRSSPLTMISNLRLQAAASDLAQGDLFVKEAALRAGFTDQLYFTRLFKRSFGMAPTLYREKVRRRPS